MAQKKSLRQKVSETIAVHSLLSGGESVVVGFSGGADSLALTHILFSLGYAPTAVHVHHGLRGAEADADENFVRAFCEALGIPLMTYHFDVRSEAAARKLSTEEAGRILRYRAFEEVRKQVGAEKIAVAHNQNDNAETFLMRLCRGTGLKGLSGIAPVRENIIRPLIYASRAEIEAYCAENALDYRTDSTNAELTYTRNKIRRLLIPMLQENFNPDIVRGLAKTAALLSEENEFIEIAADKAYQECAGNGAWAEAGAVRLNMEVLKAQPVVIRRRIVRKACANFSAHLRDIGFDHVESMLALTDKPTGSEVYLPGGIVAERVYGFLVLRQKSSPAAEGFCYKIEIDQPLFIPELDCTILLTKSSPHIFNILYTKTICCDKIDRDMQIRTRKPGDSIFVKSMGGRKKLKDYFIDDKLLRTERDKVPLLCNNAEVICILDAKGIVSDHFKVSAETRQKLHIYLYGGE